MLKISATILSRLLFASTLTILTLSCYRAQNCQPTTRDYVIIEFVDSLGAPLEKMLTITSLTSSSSIVENDISSSTFELPLDPYQDNVTFVFSDSNEENWMSLGYRNAVFINSEDCGPEFVFSDLVLWGTSYDSVRVLDKQILAGVQSNIRIYD